MDSFTVHEQAHTVVSVELPCKTGQNAIWSGFSPQILVDQALELSIRLTSSFELSMERCDLIQFIGSAFNFLLEPLLKDSDVPFSEVFACIEQLVDVRVVDIGHNLS